MPKQKINMRVDVDELAEIDNAAAAVGVKRTEYLVSSALARARGGDVTPELALQVLAKAISR